MARCKSSTVVIGLALALLVWGGGRPASALDADRSLDHYEHAAWTVKEGAPPDIWALAQTADGFLWLGTGSGLYRFDGVKFERVNADVDASPRSSNIQALFASPTGELWVGYDTGDIGVIKNGRLTRVETGLLNDLVKQFAQDHDGVVWAATRDGLARYASGRWRKVGADYGFPEGATSAVAVSNDGAVWAAAATSLDLISMHDATVYSLPPGAKRFIRSRQNLFKPGSMANSPDGRLWLGDSRGVDEVLTTAAGRIVPRLTFQSPGYPIQIAFDRDGSLWGAARGRGVIHASLDTARSRPATPRVEWFTTKDGLTADIATAILKDREGNIWIGTNQGLDRFRAVDVVRKHEISAKELRYYFALGPRQSSYLDVDNDIYRLDANATPRRILTSTARIYCLGSSRDGGVWIGKDGGLLEHLAKGRLQRVALPDGAGKSPIFECAEDPRGSVWVAVWKSGLFRLERGGWRKVEIPADLAMADMTGLTFGAKGETWLAFGEKAVRLDEGGARRFSTADGLDVGEIQTITPTPDGLLIGGDSGVARFDGRRFRSLHSREYSVLEKLSGIVQTRAGDTWMYGTHGLVRARTQDLNLAFEGRRPLSYQLLDFHDGVPGPAQQDSGSPALFQAWDGRLWLLSNHGVAWLDPSHLSRNKMPPPVAITALTGAGRTLPYDRPMKFPGGTSNVQIDFTALCLAVPERVRFRYKLEGVDKDWVDAGGRRQAFYTRLGPGRYRFRVIAANNDGVWNRTGAAAVFTIAPTFYQSGWFITLCVLAALGALFAAHKLRIEFVSTLMQQRLGERLRERERIARELHDTLLQGLQGLMLSFKSAASRFPAGHAGREAMDRALVGAEEALTEGRERVQDLRATDVPLELSELLALAAQKFGANAALKVQMVTEGRPRELHPLVSQELVRIGEEAIFNTLRHAEARTLEIGVAYGSSRLTVWFNDDGKGIEPHVVKDGLAGHYGLRGMRERALRIQSNFTLTSAPGAGAGIQVVVPAKVAYACALKTGFPALRRAVEGH